MCTLGVLPYDYAQKADMSKITGGKSRSKQAKKPLAVDSHVLTFKSYEALSKGSILFLSECTYLVTCDIIVLLVSLLTNLNE